MTGTARIIHGNALDLPLPDESVDLVVTSPPYFGLRSYQDGGRHYDGQIGAEPTPAEFVDALIAATREMVRVLKPTGSIWVNLGDRYDARKSLMDLPHRYAIRCVDDLRLIQRAEVIWAKANGLPESVTDRVRRSHEVWFHFTKSPRYFSAVDEIREAPTTTVTATGTTRYLRQGEVPSGAQQTRIQTKANPDRGNEERAGRSDNLLGKLPGSVWTVAVQPLRVPPELGVDHFAAYPMELPRRIIRGWSPVGVCVKCGEGRRPVVEVAPDSRKPYATIGAKRRTPQGGHQSTRPMVLREDGRGGDFARNERRITGYACACTPWHAEPRPTDRDPDNDVTVYDWHLWDAPATTPAVVLDPFGGTGTTALVAKALGQVGISVDMSADYCRLAEWRTNDRDQLAAAMQVDKPANKPLAGQLGLFGDDAA